MSLIRDIMVFVTLKEQKKREEAGKENETRPVFPTHEGDGENKPSPSVNDCQHQRPPKKGLVAGKAFHPSRFSRLAKFLITLRVKGLTGFLGVLEPPPTHVLFSG